MEWVSLGGSWKSVCLDLTVKEWVQNGLLTVFFLVIGLDLRQEMATGTLHNPRQALLPCCRLSGVMAPQASICSSTRVALNVGLFQRPWMRLSPWRP